MTERLADISARIEGIRQLGAVVNAMKGIAGARAHVARTQVQAVDSYANTIAGAMASVLHTSMNTPHNSFDSGSAKRGMLVFTAEQGFAGAFSERVLEAFAAEDEPELLFLIGTRGAAIAQARGLAPYWTAPLPSHTPGIPKLADRITTAIYRAVAERRINCLDALFTGWVNGRPVLLRQPLFPIDLENLPPATATHPMTHLAEEPLIAALGQDYFNAQVCKAALHAFASENEARMEAMASAGAQIARELETFQAKLRRVRQEAITAEIIELGTGTASAEPAR